MNAKFVCLSNLFALSFNPLHQSSSHCQPRLFLALSFLDTSILLGGGIGLRIWAEMEPIERVFSAWRNPLDLEPLDLEAFATHERECFAFMCLILQEKIRISRHFFRNIFSLIMRLRLV